MPATEPYLLLGLTAITTFPLLLGASIVLRRRNLERDHDMLDELENHQPSESSHGSDS